MVFFIFRFIFHKIKNTLIPYNYYCRDKSNIINSCGATRLGISFYTLSCVPTYADFVNGVFSPAHLIESKDSCFSSPSEAHS